MFTASKISHDTSYEVFNLNGGKMDPLPFAGSAASFMEAHDLIMRAPFSGYPREMREHMRMEALLNLWRTSHPCRMVTAREYRMMTRRFRGK